MTEIWEVKQKIHNLIDETTAQNNKQKELLSFLYQKLEEVKELEALEQLKEYRNGLRLKAYLFYLSIKRANFQVEHLKLTRLENAKRCLEMIVEDLEANQPKTKHNSKELTNQQLYPFYLKKWKKEKLNWLMKAI